MDFSREIMKVAKSLKASDDLSQYITFDTRRFIKDISDDIKIGLSNINDKYDARLEFRAILENSATIVNKNDPLFVCNIFITYDNWKVTCEYNVGTFQDKIVSTPNLPISEKQIVKKIIFEIQSYLNRTK